MKTKFLLPLVLAILTSLILASCDGVSKRGNRRTGGMSAWERSRR